MSWDKIISTFLSVNPISAVSITFSLLFFFSSRSSMKNLEKMHITSMNKIKDAYSDNLKMLKSLVENITKK